jgi:hypothetical protein
MGDLIYPIVGGALAILGMVGYELLLSPRSRRARRPKGAAAACPLCDHIKAGHDSLGCGAKVTGSMGSQRCPCSRKYGEPS